MNAQIQTTAHQDDGWQIARVKVKDGDTRMVFSLRFNGQAIHYIATHGSHTLGVPGDAALQNWLALQKRFTSPDVQGFIARWHKKAAATAGNQP